MHHARLHLLDAAGMNLWRNAEVTSLIMLVCWSLLKLYTGKNWTDKSQRANDWPKLQLTWLKQVLQLQSLCGKTGNKCKNNQRTPTTSPTTSSDPQSKGRVQVVMVWRHSICSLFMCQYAPAAATKSWTARASWGGFTFRRWAKGAPRGPRKPSKIWKWKG